MSYINFVILLHRTLREITKKMINGIYKISTAKYKIRAESCALQWENKPQKQKNYLVCDFRWYSRLWFWILKQKSRSLKDVEMKFWELLNAKLDRVGKTSRFIAALLKGSDVTSSSRRVCLTTWIVGRILNSSIAISGHSTDHSSRSEMLCLSPWELDSW